MIATTILLPARRLAPVLASSHRCKTVLIAEIALGVQTVFEDLLGDGLPRTRLRRGLNDGSRMLGRNTPMVLVVVVDTEAIQRIKRLVLRLQLLVLITHLDQFNVRTLLRFEVPNLEWLQTVRLHLACFDTNLSQVTIVFMVAQYLLGLRSERKALLAV